MNEASAPCHSGIGPEIDRSPYLGHGGNLAYATHTFGQPKNGWQDLSTGISPWAYPAPPVPDSVWQRLPDDNTELKDVAARYYGVAPENVLALPGTQVAISRLPYFLSAAKVAIPAIGYTEHQRAWTEAGHTSVFYRNLQELLAMAINGLVHHAVIIHPNNPTGEVVDKETLRKVADALRNRGVVVVDEAFIDRDSAQSITALLGALPNLLVLRSIGKFFGLAGLRLGFLLGSPARDPIKQLTAELTPWGVSHPAQWLGYLALQDTEWQDLQRVRIAHAADHLADLWRGHLDSDVTVMNRGLFVTLRGNYQRLFNIYQSLGYAGIYTRWCHWPESYDGIDLPWLRCGLPDDGGARLQGALSGCASIKNI